MIRSKRLSFAGNTKIRKYTFESIIRQTAICDTYKRPVSIKRSP